MRAKGFYWARWRREMNAGRLAEPFLAYWDGDRFWDQECNYQPEHLDIIDEQVATPADEDPRWTSSR